MLFRSLSTSLDPLQSGGAGVAFSRFVACLLLVVYGLTLLFSLRTHRALYDVAHVELEPTHAAVGSDSRDSDTTGVAAAPSVAASEHLHPAPPLLPWIAVLLAATLGLAYASELFVGVVESVSEGLGLSSLFTGVVLLPLLGGVAEYLTAVSMARRNKMDLAVSVALGSTLLVALLVVPVLVLVGPVLGHPLDLSFQPYELVAIGTAVLVSNLASLDGRSDWLEGVLLLAAYLILAAGFYFANVSIG